MKVGLITPDRPPYFFAGTKGEQPTGLYIDILDRITEGLPVELEYYFLPQARIRKYMKSGKLDIEPGVNSAWRTLPNEVASSVYSISFMESHEVFTFLGDKNKAIDFKESIVCSINGFNLPEEFNVDNTHFLTTEKQLYSMIIKKRCDLAIAPIDVINYWNKRSPEKINFTEIVSSHQLMIRLHQKHKGLLKVLNSNIEALKKSGDLKKIKQKYIH